MIKSMPYIRTASVAAGPALLSQTRGLLTKVAGPTTRIIPPTGVAPVVGSGVVGGVMNYIRQNPLLILGGVALLAMVMRKKRK
jgi:hypothetical protein